MKKINVENLSKKQKELKKNYKRKRKKLHQTNFLLTIKLFLISFKLSEIMKMTERIEIPVYEYEKSNKELL